VLGPECADSLVALARAISDGKRTFESIPGAWLPNRDDVPLQPSRPSHLKVDRTGMHPLSQYTALHHQGALKTVGYTEATRGCKHTCLHCPLTPVYQGRFFALDRGDILSDMDSLVAAGAQHITFGDADFLNGPTHSLKITDALYQRHPHVTWDATIKVEHILEHADLFPVFKERGCLFVVSAVESLSDDVLSRLHKGHTGADVGRALHVLRDAGIIMRPTFLAFTPWTTAADFLRLCDFIDSHELHDQVDAVQMAVRLLIPPGSALLESVQHEPWLGPLDKAALSYTWTHLDVRMDALSRELADLVAAASTTENDPVETLLHVMQVARERLGAPRREYSGPMRAGPPAPRLTEHWFC